MDEKVNQAEETRVPAADQAPQPETGQAPSASAEHGVGGASAQTASDPERDAASSDANDAPDPVSPSTTPDAATASQANAEEAPGEAERAGEADGEGGTAAAPSEMTGETTGEATGEAATESGAEPGADLVSAEPTVEAGAEPTTAEPTTMEEAMTMEDVLAASDEQLAKPPIHRGMIVTGTVIMLQQEGIVVDVGAKIEGLIPYNQLFEFDVNAEEAAKYFKPGDEVQVYVVRADIPNNTIILSKKRADQERAWGLLQDIFDKGLPVEVEIVEKVRGGLVANLGVRAFLPASQVDIRRVNDLEPYVGKRLKVKIIELNRKRNRVIISRRAILEEEVKEQKAETLKKLEPGLQLEGEVVEITDFGAFVNLGGVDGLVHRSELSHGRFNHPREVVQLGQKVKVEVLDMDLERERINLSMKKLIPNPWENVLLNYAIGQRVTGKVTNLTPFGAFVEIEPGLEGLIHVSEMSWTKRIRHPKEMLEEGQEVEAMILKIDSEQQRISLGLRQTQPDPWSSLPDRYPPGTEVTGPITGITDFGVFMEIEEGIEGLVHISELAHEHIERIEDHFQRGDEISAVILNIDPVEQRASLSRKRLLPYTAGDSAMPLGAPERRSGGRKGRRGGRRSAGIDYDYSYASATDPASRATTKLGDVYADLFAQFGLSESKPEEKAEADAKAKSDTKEAEAQDAKAQDTQDTKAEAQVDASPEAQEGSAEAQAPESERAEAPRAREAEEPVDPENAIDAAEAAALLTAAFREGKRPLRQDVERTDSATVSAAESTAETDAETNEQADTAEERDEAKTEA